LLLVATATSATATPSLAFAAFPFATAPTVGGRRGGLAR
jgi:hypothetical protein